MVVDAYHGAAPRSAHSYKNELRLAEFLEPDGRIAQEGAGPLAAFVREAAAVAERLGCRGTARICHVCHPRGAERRRRPRHGAPQTGVDLQVLSGADEARLTFLAVRRWFGWSSGRLLVFDIGGGSLEVAVGVNEDPDGAFSLPLGAGRLTREFFPEDPPHPSEIKRLRRYVRAEIAEKVAEITVLGDASRIVGTSKTFKQLARLTGAAPSSVGPYVQRALPQADLADWVPKLAQDDRRRPSHLAGNLARGEPIKCSLVQLLLRR